MQYVLRSENMRYFSSTAIDGVTKQLDEADKFPNIASALNALQERCTGTEYKTSFLRCWSRGITIMRLVPVTTYELQEVS